MNKENNKTKLYVICKFGIGLPANRIIFRFDQSFCGRQARVFDNEYEYSSFEEDVVEFLARISLTHTIIDIDENMNNGRTHSEFVVWTKPSFDTNIDADTIYAILKNISGK